MLALSISTAAAIDDVETLVDRSLALCTSVDQLPVEDRLPLLQRGLELADAAVAGDDRSARAHFAVVCNLGKATGLNGFRFGAFRAIYRLREEVDVTLALAPDHPDALAAKGALLLRLPRLLGGDPAEAEQWFRRALAVDPMNAVARSYLDEIESQRGGVTAANTATVE